MPRILTPIVSLLNHIERSSNAPPIKPINSAGTHQYLYVATRAKSSSGNAAGWTVNALVAEPIGLYVDRTATYPSQGGLQLQTNAMSKGGHVHSPYSGLHGSNFQSSSAVSMASGGVVFTGPLVRRYPNKAATYGGSTADASVFTDAIAVTSSQSGITYDESTGAFTLPSGIYLCNVRLFFSSLTSGNLVSFWWQQTDASSAVNTNYTDVTKYCYHSFRSPATGGRVQGMGILFVGSDTDVFSTYQLHVLHSEASAVNVQATEIFFNKLVDLSPTRQDP